MPVALVLMMALLGAGEERLQWQALPDLPMGVFNAAATLAGEGEDIVVTGGLNQGGRVTDWVQVYRAKPGRWHTHVLLNPSRCNQAQVTLDDRHILIVAGQTGGVREKFTDLASCQIIDIAEQTSEPIPDLPYTMASPTAHRLADGSVIVIGGRTAALFDPRAKRWVKFIELRQTRKWHASVLLDEGRVLVVGGENRKTLELIDVSAGTSQLMSSRLPQGLDDLAAAALPDGRVLIMAGQRSDTGETIDGNWVFDAAADKLQDAPAMGIPGGVADHAVATLGPWIFSVGGETEQAHHDTELTAGRVFDARTLRIWSLPDTVTPHDDAVALPWRHGVVIIGGFRYTDGPFGSMKIPTASRVVETLQLPAPAFR